MFGASLDRTLRVAVDLTELEQQHHFDAGAEAVQVRFVQALIAHAPGAEFVLLARPDTYPALAHLEGANARRLSVANRGAWELLLRRLAARVPGRVRRLRGAGHVARFESAQQLLARLRPGQLAKISASVVFCPFTSSRVRDPAVPLVAAMHDLQHLSHPHLLTSAERARRAHAVEMTTRHARRVILSAASLAAVLGAGEDLARERVLRIGPGRLLACAPHIQRAATVDLARHHLEKDGFLLFPAEVEARQNHRLVLTAFAIFRAACPASEMRLVCVGGPQARMAALRATAERMGLGAWVRFPGALPRQDVAGLMQSCRAVVIPSLYESIGEVLLRAMQLGRPAVCSQIPDLADLAGSAALLFDPHRPAELAAAFQRVEQDSELVDRLSRLGRERAAQLPAPQHVAESYLAVLREARTPWPASR